MEATFANNGEDGSGNGTYSATSKRSSGSDSDWESKKVGRRRTIVTGFLTFLIGAVIGVGIMALLFTQSFTVKRDLCSPFALDQYVTTAKTNLLDQATMAEEREITPAKTSKKGSTASAVSSEKNLPPQTTEVSTRPEDEVSTSKFTSSPPTTESIATTQMSSLTTTAATTKLFSPTTRILARETESYQETTKVTTETSPHTTTTEATTKGATEQTTESETEPTTEATTLEDTTAVPDIDLTTVFETTEIETTSLTTTTKAPTTTTREITELPIVTTESEVTTGNPVPNGCDIEYERKCFRAVVTNVLDVHWNESKMLCEMEGWKLGNVYSLSHYYMLLGYLRQNFPKSGYISAWTGMRMIPQDLQIVLSTGKNITLWNIQWNKDYPSKYSSDTHMGIDLIMLPSRETILSQGLWNYDPSWNGNSAICEQEY